jgi:Amino acid permease
VRDSAAAFAAPTYLFLAAIALIVIAGLIKAGSNGFHPVPRAPHRATEALGVLLVLCAFASGATAMTGIEVISNAVPVFRPPEAVHARQALGVMVRLLISMFVGVVLVAHFDGAAPGDGQTVLSQIAHRSVGSGIAYGFVQLATTLVLLVAANSAFNGFPRLLYVMPRDGFAPRVFLRMGDRPRVHQRHPVLAVPAAAIYAAFGGQTSPLIRLFASRPASPTRAMPRADADTCVLASAERRVGPLLRAARTPAIGARRIRCRIRCERGWQRESGGNVVRPGEGERLWFVGTLATIRIPEEVVDGRFALTEFLFPHHASPQLHTHPQDESYFMLEGRLTVRVATGGLSSWLAPPRSCRWE